MDPIDYRILDLLQRDARTTQAQIASAVGLSQPSIADRIKKLDASGAVVGYVARLDPRRMGNDIRAFIGVRISHPRHHDAFARRIVGWRVSRTAHASFVLDALEQALHDRHPVQGSGLVHHSDRGVQGGFN